MRPLWPGAHSGLPRQPWGNSFVPAGGFPLPGGDGSIGTYPRCCPLVTAMCAVLDVTGAGLAGTFRKGNL